MGHLTYSWIILCILIFNSSPTFAGEKKSLLPRIEILTPGMTRSIEITQDANFPLDSSQFLVVLLGYSFVTISMYKNDTEGDLLVLTGVGISSAGIVPFLKFGVTATSLAVSIEIGKESSPYGLLLFSTWIDEPEDEPYNRYNLTLSF